MLIVSFDPVFWCKCFFFFLQTHKGELVEAFMCFFFLLAWWKQVVKVDLSVSPKRKPRMLCLHSWLEETVSPFSQIVFSSVAWYSRKRNTALSFGYECESFLHAGKSIWTKCQADFLCCKGFMLGWGMIEMQNPNSNLFYDRWRGQHFYHLVNRCCTHSCFTILFYWLPGWQNLIVYCKSWKSSTKVMLLFWSRFWSNSRRTAF